MAVILDERTRVCIQGIGDPRVPYHLRQMLEYGTRVVAATAAGVAGADVAGIPVLATVEEAVDRRGATASLLFVPAREAKDASFEAIDAGISLLVVISEFIPVHDAMEIVAFAAAHNTTLVGPNTFGVISPGKARLGIMPNRIHSPGPVGVIARGSTLTYEIVQLLTQAGLGQSTVVGIGGDRVHGLNFTDCLRLMERDPETKAVVLVGEIGGRGEEDAAEFIKGMTKPVVAFVAGRTAPANKRMGHAGAIIERGRGTFAGKVEALRRGGARVAELPSEVPALVQTALGKS